MVKREFLNYITLDSWKHLADKYLKQSIELTKGELCYGCPVHLCHTPCPNALQNIHCYLEMGLHLEVMKN